MKRNVCEENFGINDMSTKVTASKISSCQNLECVKCVKKGNIAKNGTETKSHEWTQISFTEINYTPKSSHILPN